MVKGLGQSPPSATTTTPKCKRETEPSPTTPGERPSTPAGRMTSTPTTNLARAFTGSRPTPGKRRPLFQPLPRNLETKTVEELKHLCKGRRVVLTTKDRKSSIITKLEQHEAARMRIRSFVEGEATPTKRKRHQEADRGGSSGDEDEGAQPSQKERRQTIEDEGGGSRTPRKYVEPNEVQGGATALGEATKEGDQGGGRGGGSQGEPRSIERKGEKGEASGNDLRKPETAILGRIPAHTPSKFRPLDSKLGKFTITHREASNYQGTNKEHSPKSTS